MRKTRGVALLLFTCIILSACNGKRDTSNTKSTEETTKATEDTKSTANANTSRQSRLDELEEDHTLLTFVEGEDFIVEEADYDSLPEEWQEVAKDPFAITTSLVTLGIIEFHEREEKSELLKQNPDSIVPIVKLISIIADKIKTDDRYDPDHLPPNEEAELRKLVDSLR